MKLWLQNELLALKNWIPQCFEISCINNFSVSHMLCACFTVCSRSELWQSKTDLFQLCFNIDLILQNQHLKLLMLQGKQKEYSVKDPNPLTDSVVLRHVPQKKKKKNNLSKFLPMVRRNSRKWSGRIVRLMKFKSGDATNGLSNRQCFIKLLLPKV